MSNLAILTKTELSEELHISQPRVTQLIKRGMPTRSDGRIDTMQACEWIIRNLDEWRENNSIARSHASELLWLLRRRAERRRRHRVL
jgi:hypothetical protein